MTAPTPTTDRRLLADIHRWARANGWATHRDTGWQNPSRTIQVDWDERGLHIGERASVDRLWPAPRHYHADSVRQAVNLLVDLGVLPIHLHSAYGVEAVIADREAQAASPEVANAVAFTLEMELRPWSGPRSIPAEHLRRIAARLVRSAAWIRPAGPGCDCSATGGQGLVPTASREHADDCPAVTR